MLSLQFTDFFPIVNKKNSKRNIENIKLRYEHLMPYSSYV